MVVISHSIPGEAVDMGSRKPGRHPVRAGRKPPSDAAGTPWRIRSIFEPNKAAVAAVLVPKVQKPAKGGNGDGEDGIRRCISTALNRKNRRPAPTGSAADALDERKEVKIGSCAFAAAARGAHDPPHGRGRAVAARHDRGAAKRGCDGEDARGLLIKKRCCWAAAAICESRTASLSSLCQISREAHSMKPLSARIEGEGVTSQSDCRVVKQTSKIISTHLGYEALKDKLNGMGISVSAVTLIHEKKLSESDCNGQSRLLLPKSIEDSPLFHMLTEAENQLVRTGNSKDDGLQVLTLDRHGRSYHMRFKYLGCTKAYRLIGQWGQLVAQNGLRSGDSVELGAFRRVDGQLMFTLLHFAKACEASQAKETEASKEDLPSRQDTEVSKASMLTEVAKEDSTSMEIDEHKEGWTYRETLAKEDWSSRELEAAVALFILSGVEDDTK